MPPQSHNDSRAFDRALVIANPRAGNARRRLAGAVALARVAQCGGRAELALTEAPGHATRLAAEWAAAGHDLVVAVGGDGTVHETALGLLGTRCALAVLPSGSGDDFAQGIGAGTVAAGLRNIARGEDVAVDACALDDMVFVNSCGLLASGLVSGTAAGYWRWLGGARYTLAAARTLLGYRGQSVDWRLSTANGIESLAGRFLMAEVCNGPLTGGGFRFAPDASLTDGRFDLALIRPLGLLPGLRLLPAASRGERITHPAVSVRQAVGLSFEVSGSVAYHLDGEPGILPAGRHEIRVLPEKLRVRLLNE